jgi:hypothetical protein
MLLSLLKKFYIFLYYLTAVGCQHYFDSGREEEEEEEAGPMV